jgi:murein DD-endopeptidase MepM/ murein hydrolase activator NlpD
MRLEKLAEGWVMPVALLLTAGAATAGEFEVRPLDPAQGRVIRISGPAGADAARMDGRTVRLFPQAGGVALGLMPVPANQAPGEYTLEILTGGATRESVAVRVTDARFRRQNIVLSPQSSELKPAPGEMETARAFRETVSERRYWQEPFALPVAGCRTSPYGVQRFRNGKPTGDYHAGIDQRAAAGSPVRAVAAGVVRLAKAWNIHGNAVGIDHGQGVESIYLHLSRFAVAEGAQVARGDVIGYAGSTGRSTAPHLHWSVYVNGVPVDPSQWVGLSPCAAAPAKGRKRKR